MRFQKPERVRDKEALIKELALASVKVVLQDYKGAKKHLPDIWKAFRGKVDTSPEAQAWRFVTSSIAHAATEVLCEPRMRTDLSETELATAIEEFLESAPDEGELRPVDITNLSLSPDLQPGIDAFVGLAKRVAPDTPFTDKQIEANFKSALAASVSAASAQDSEAVQPLVDALRGPVGEGVEREIAWQRHAGWVRSLFFEDPIFSPDGDEETPLSQVYLRLRCHWNEEHSKAREGNSTRSRSNGFS